MNIIETHNLSEQQKNDIIELWNEEYPEKLNYKSIIDFENYLSDLLNPRHLLILSDKEHVVGWCFSFRRDGEKWFAIILHSSIQRKGLGRLLLDKIKYEEVQLNGWVTDHSNDRKINGTPYQSPLDFYIKNDFKVLTDQRIELAQISAVKIAWQK